jgi:hypothetical protein
MTVTNIVSGTAQVAASVVGIRSASILSIQTVAMAENLELSVDLFLARNTKIFKCSVAVDLTH